MRIGYVIVFVGHMQEAVAFYRDVVGLPLRFESPDWSEFDTGDATLALHAVREGGDPTDLPAGRCRPGFQVPDLDAFHARMIASNVSCIEEPHLVFGSKVAQYAGPDGLPFSVGESREGEA